MSPLPALVALATLALLPAQAFTTTLFFNYTLDALSPLLSYDPPESGPGTRWTTAWTNASWSSPARVGAGRGYRWIETDALAERASVSWRFPSTAFYVLGAAGLPPASALVDGKQHALNAALSPANDSAALPSLVRLPWAANNVSYQGAGGILMVDGVVLTTGIMSDAANWDDIVPTTVPAGTNDSLAAETTMNLTIPAHTAFIAINGSVAPDGGTLLAQLDPAPPAWISDYPIARLSTANPWQANTTLFASILDPGVQYVLHLSAEGGPVRLGTASFYAGNPNVTGGTAFNDTPSVGPEPSARPAPAEPATSGPASTSRKSHTGAIAGGVVGGVVALALLAALALFLVRRHRATPPTADDRSEKMLVDDAPPPEDTPVSPFLLDTKAADYLGAKDFAGTSPTGSTSSWAAGTLSAMSRARPPSTAPESALSSPLEPEVDAGPLERPPPTYNPAWDSPSASASVSALSSPSEAAPPPPPVETGKNLRALPALPREAGAQAGAQADGPSRSYSDLKAAIIRQ
ncbi:hypothetical protein Q8F55_002896 [Vanrija albida]|uniref:Uncharacterized protein n=1 Tax=Vanrija albida TaxID=181172 RepID=A0ABR3QB16_9TREE